MLIADHLGAKFEMRLTVYTFRFQSRYPALNDFPSKWPEYDDAECHCFNGLQWHYLGSILHIRTMKRRFLGETAAFAGEVRRCWRRWN